MLNELYFEPDWVAQGPTPERPHMESNRWLTSVCTTRPSRQRAAPEVETFDLLGVKLVWTKDRNRPFPAPILDAVKRLLEFAELRTGWDSHNGFPLQIAAGKSVVQLVVEAHRYAQFPRMHPLSDGGVGLVWDGDSELEILVAGDGTVEGLLSVGNDEVELAPGSTVASGVELLERFFNHR